MKLTPSQRRLLIAADRHMFGRVVGGSDRTYELLAGDGLIEPDGYLHGRTLFKITDRGRAVVLNHHKHKKEP